MASKRVKVWRAHPELDAEAVPPERGRKLRCSRHHEAKLGILIREFALQVEEIRAGNMPGLKRVLSRHGEVGSRAAGGRGFEIGCAIEQPQVWLIEDAGEFRCGDEPVAPWHAGLRYFCRCYGGRHRMKRRGCPLLSALSIRPWLSNIADRVGRPSTHLLSAGMVDLKH